MGKLEAFWTCPQHETLQRMREDPARFFPGERPPYYCSVCTGPCRKYPPECIITGYGYDLTTPRKRQRLAKKINRALRRRKCQLNAERRQQEADDFTAYEKELQARAKEAFLRE